MPTSIWLTVNHNRDPSDEEWDWSVWLDDRTSTMWWGLWQMWWTSAEVWLTKDITWGIGGKENCCPLSKSYLRTNTEILCR